MKIWYEVRWDSSPNELYHHAVPTDTIENAREMARFAESDLDEKGNHRYMNVEIVKCTEEVIA